MYLLPVLTAATPMSCIASISVANTIFPKKIVIYRNYTNFIAFLCYKKLKKKLREMVKIDQFCHFQPLEIRRFGNNLAQSATLAKTPTHVWKAGLPLFLRWLWPVLVPRWSSFLWWTRACIGSKYENWPFLHTLVIYQYTKIVSTTTLVNWFHEGKEKKSILQM